MQSGRLRRQIDLQKPVLSAPDQYGAVNPAYTQFMRVWADIQPITGRETDYAHGFQATATHRITIRYLPGSSPQSTGVLPSWQIKYGSRTFAINGVINVSEKNRTLLLFCTELVQ